MSQSKVALSEHYLSKSSSEDLQLSTANTKSHTVDLAHMHVLMQNWHFRLLYPVRPV